MDAIDSKIIGLLAEDARRSLADIGSHAGLSASAVNERIRRLVDAGTIRRFTVEVDPVAMGWTIMALIWVELPRDTDEDSFRHFAASHPAVAECHHVTGIWSYLLKVWGRSIADIEGFLSELKQHRLSARSETVLALSTVVDTVVPPSKAD